MRHPRTTVALLVLFTAALSAAATRAETPLPEGLTKPNIVFVLTDDLAINLLPYMPNVQAMQKDGATFSRYFVTNSLCCPSRATIFTGQFPHNTGVVSNDLPDGGYEVFNQRGNEAETFALALQGQGYRTAMMGKYLNGYRPKTNPPASGWDEWDVAGGGYDEFNYELNENGKSVRHRHDPADYLTDVLAVKADQFIRQSAGGPFFLEVATFAPHGPYVPAPRDADAFPDLKAPRTPAYGADPDANAPSWLKAIPALRPKDVTKLDHIFRLRAQSVRSVDKMVGEIRATLDALGIADKTYVVFSSDNGFHIGEYRLRPGKMTAYDTDIQVPLIVVGPGVATGKVIDEITENIDLCPTFTDLGGNAGATKPDGRSLVPLLLGAPTADWRQAALIEHHRPDDFAPGDPDAPSSFAANPISYEALRTTDALYVEYENGEVNLYDLPSDPYELRNVAPSTPKDVLDKYSAALAAMKTCAGGACSPEMPTD